MASSSKKTDNAAEIDRLALALAKEPGSKVFIPLAEEYGKVGRWEEAVVVLEDGLKTYPGFITAMVALGRAYEQVNQPVKAKAILEEAIKVSPDNLRAHRTLAKLYAAQGAKDAAIRSCNVILAVNPQDQEALALRASQDHAVVPECTPGSPQPPEELDRPQSDHPAEVPLFSVAKGTAHVTETGDAQVASTLSDLAQRAKPVAAALSLGPQGSSRSSIARLEQWLQLIQARRRDGSTPSQSIQKTSA
ncbi:MAG: tetratricopeptide repeat protein [Nitrospira sp.]|nr:tetratricopeptide repeat protein [Nitrospira sp.]MDH4302758.1 tetratricopeptide repeat protein [Nitrospira sp.]MDH5192158.1 tetratricopeptide repeat protein [Nitrospira sp.]